MRIRTCAFLELIAIRIRMRLSASVSIVIDSPELDVKFSKIFLLPFHHEDMTAFGGDGVTRRSHYDIDYLSISWLTYPFWHQMT